MQWTETVRKLQLKLQHAFQSKYFEQTNETKERKEVMRMIYFAGEKVHIKNIHRNN